jgi:hypothetical protein
MRLSIRALLLALVAGAMSPSMRALQLPSADAPCNMTTPNGIVAGLSERQEWSYGNTLLSVGPFGLWPNGTVIFKPGGAGFITGDGALGMKFGWTRGVRGKLKVSGHRLDGAAAPLLLEANDGYGDFGFQASYLIFPTPGCWEVNAQVGEREDSKIMFVTKVVKIGEGPSWRRNPSVSGQAQARALARLIKTP